MVSPYFLTNIAPGCTVLVNMKGVDMKRLLIILALLVFVGCATPSTVSKELKYDPIGTVGFGVLDVFIIGEGLLW